MSLCFAEAQSFTSVIQKGHGEAVKSAQFIEEGKFILSASRDKTVKLWDAESGMEMRSFIGHQQTVNGISYAENRVATSSADNTAIVWDLLSGNIVWQSEEFSGYVTAVAFSSSGNLLAVGSYEDSVSIYNTSDFTLDRRIRVNPDKGVGYGVSLQFSKDDKYLTIGQDNRTAKLYTTSDWKEVGVFKPESGYCGGCGTLTAFSPKSTNILRLSNGSTLVKYDVISGEVIWESERKFKDVSSVSYHENGFHFLAATEDSIFVYSNKSNDVISSFSLDGEVNSADFHPSEDQLLIALNKVVVLTDLKGRELKRYHGILNNATTGLDYDLGSYWEHYIAKWVKYKPAQMLDRTSLYIGKTAHKARKWNVNKASISMEYLGHEKGILCFERIGEGILATGGGDGKIIIWNEHTGKIIKEIEAHREPIFDLALSNDGKRLASCAWDGVINVWNTGNWNRDTYSYNEGNSAYNIEFTDNDAYLVVGLLDKTLRLLEPETKRFVKEFVGHTDVVTSISIQGNEILTSGWDGKAMIWDLTSGLIKVKIALDRPCFSAKFFGDELVTAGADRTIIFWDREGNRGTELVGHQAEINGMQMEGNLLVSSDVDGTTKFWDIAKKEELFEHIQVGKNDWMVKTPTGYFDATDQAVSNIHFVKDLNVYSSSQFFQEFYRPGLVQNIFSDTRTGKTSIDQQLQKSPPPVVKLSGTGTGSDSAKLFIKVEDVGGGAEAIKLFHNGRSVEFEKSIIKTRKVDEKTKVYTFSQPLVAGVNEFSASAFSREGVESSRSTFSVLSDSKKPGSRCHILAVGINEYVNSSLNLNYAKPDASSFAAQMQVQGRAIYSDVIVHQLFDEDATKKGILSKISKLVDQVSPNDVFIFYYAGHGSIVDEKFYLISSNASRLFDNQRVAEFGIEAGVLKEAMLNIKALKQVIIMDACQSGGSVEVLAQRGAPEEKAIAQLSRSSGIHVMASAGSEQYASEFASLGHGLFTHLLLQGLNGAADGAPKDGKVTIFELKSYLDDQVPELSIELKGSPQYPNTFSRGQDFPIVIIK